MKKDELIEAIRKAQRQTKKKEPVQKASGKTQVAQGKIVKRDASPAPGKSDSGKQSNSVKAGKGMGAVVPAPAKKSSPKSAAIAPVSRSSSAKGGSAKGPAVAGAKKVASAVVEKVKREVKAKGAAKPKLPERPPTEPRIVKVLRKQQAAAESRKDLSASVVVHAQGQGKGEGGTRTINDRLVLIVRDSYWLQASWEIARATIERARAAMGVDWHAAEPVLRLMEVAHGASANAAEKVVRDVPIHGGVNNWYLDVENPPARFRVLIGYKSQHGRFYTICKSNVVQTPEPGACDPIDGHWQDIAEDYERIYSLSESDNGTGSNDLREMFEERLQRQMPDTNIDAFQSGGEVGFRREKDLPFEVDAELIVYGSTTPGATVTLAGEPVRLSADGTFTVRMELPDKRQVIPVVACSRDGMRQRTTVVAVERNTKVMEAVSRHNME
jgi:hypothetical protein